APFEQKEHTDSTTRRSFCLPRDIVRAHSRHRRCRTGVMKRWSWFEVIPVLLTVTIAAPTNSKRRGTLNVTTCVSTWFGRAHPASRAAGSFAVVMHPACRG